MATHLTPDELHELWAELRLELRRLGGRPALFPDEADAAETDGRQLASAVVAAHDAEIGRGNWSPGASDGAAAVLAARDGRVPERLLRILDALSRMRAGTYGTCLACRSPIPFARLSAIPEASSCIECSGGGRAAGRRAAS